ncbi:MAG: DUF1257 domain-containing protein [Planctomycetes bacterium]|nr:DUF1257 domain-containing protein [Planctomycetota bacterium]
MSAVCVLTPLVISSWPAISAAVAGAAAAMGFAVEGSNLPRERQPRRRSVETEIANSEVVADAMAPAEKIVVHRGDVTIEFAPDARGKCTACVSGKKLSAEALRRIGEDVAGRVVQQFAYHRLVSELKDRNYTVVEERTLRDESVQLRIRL